MEISIFPFFPFPSELTTPHGTPHGTPQGPHNQRNQEGCSFAAPGLRTNLMPQIRITVTLGG